MDKKRWIHGLWLFEDPWMQPVYFAEVVDHIKETLMRRTRAGESTIIVGWNSTNLNKICSWRLARCARHGAWLPTTYRMTQRILRLRTSIIVVFCGTESVVRLWVSRQSGEQGMGNWVPSKFPDEIRKFLFWSCFLLFPLLCRSLKAYFFNLPNLRSRSQRRQVFF